MNPYPSILNIFKRETSRDGRGKIKYGQWTEKEFGFLANCPWIFTEKIDGTNVRIIYDGTLPDDTPMPLGDTIALRWDIDIPTKLFVAGRRHSSLPGPLFNRLSTILLPTLHDDKWRIMFGGKRLCIYGEGFGAGMGRGGGNYNPKGVDFIAFDIWMAAPNAPNGGYWMGRNHTEEICTNLGISVVPIIGGGTLWDAVREVQLGLKSRFGNFYAEGIIAKPEVELRSNKLERIVAKIKHCDFYHSHIRVDIPGYEAGVDLAKPELTEAERISAQKS